MWTGDATGPHRKSDQLPGLGSENTRGEKFLLGPSLKQEEGEIEDCLKVKRCPPEDRLKRRGGGINLGAPKSPNKKM